MRYHFDKPEIYLSMYGSRYICDHPVYNSCTLYKIGEKGLAVIQQRFDEETKSTWWSEVDPWITDALYLHPDFRKYFDARFRNLYGWSIPHRYCPSNYVGAENETYQTGAMGNSL